MTRGNVWWRVAIRGGGVYGTRGGNGGLNRRLSASLTKQMSVPPLPPPRQRQSPRRGVAPRHIIREREREIPRWGNPGAVIWLTPSRYTRPTRRPHHLACACPTRLNRAHTLTTSRAGSVEMPMRLCVAGSHGSHGLRVRADYSRRGAASSCRASASERERARASESERRRAARARASVTQICGGSIERQ